MASNAVARLLVEIVGEATNAVAAFKKTGDAAKTTEGAAQKTGASFKSIATGIATGLVVAKVVSFGKESVKAAEESAVAHERLVATFKGAGDATGALAAHAETYAAKLSQATGVDDEAIAGAQALLATFHSVSNAGAVQAGVFDRATAAAADLAAAGYGDLNSNAVQLGKALEDPVKGMAALAKSGVTFTAAQKNAIQQMEKTGNHLGAQQIVLANVESQVKGTAAATATGSAKMAVAWGNFQESVGGVLLPFITLIQTHLAGLFDFVGANSQWLVPLVLGITTAIGAILLVVKAIELFKTALAAVKIAVAFFRAAWLALNSSFIASPIGLIIIAVVALSAVIVIIATKTNWFQNIWRDVTSFTSAAWRATVGAIMAAWNAAWSFIAGIFNAIQRIAMTVWGWVRSNWPLLAGVLAGPFGIAVALVYKFWGPITGFFSGIVHSIAGVISGVVGAITSPFITAFNIVKGIVASAVGYIEGLIHRLTGIVSSGINAAKSVYNAFAHGWNAIQIKLPEIKVPLGPTIGGQTIGLPDLPILQTGGLMTRSGLIYAHAGEAITPLPRRARGDGPLVAIANATFGETVDVAVFGRRLAWELTASGVRA